LTAEALERGDLIFCEYASGDDHDDEISSEVMRETLSKLLQIDEVPPHTYFVGPNGIGDLAFQPLQKGEVLLLFEPFYDAEDVRRSLIPDAVIVPAGRSEEDEPPPMAKPANISSFQVITIFCCETD